MTRLLDMGINRLNFADALRPVAIRQTGFRTMLQDGIEKCLAGLVSIEDVRIQCATADFESLEPLSG